MLAKLIMVLLFVFILFFIGYSLYIAKGIYVQENLKKLRNKLLFGITLMFILFGISLAAIYTDLVLDGYVFKTVYKVKKSPNSSISVGTKEGNDIQLFNAFSDDEHVTFHFNDKNATVSVNSMKRSAIVNGTLITHKESESRVRVEVKNNDVITVDNKEYKVVFNDQNLSLYTLKSTYVFSSIDKIYTASNVMGKEVLVSKGKQSGIVLDTNTSFSFYFQNLNKNNKVFITLLHGDDILVNKRKLSLSVEPKPSKVAFKKGDIIRLGYSDYEIDFNDSEFILRNIFFTPSVITLFNVYSTTTLPNLAQNVSDGVVSLWWVFGATMLVVFMVMQGIFFLINLLTSKFSFIGDNRFILYPILYFSFFLSFLLFTSMINFTVLQYQQFSVLYNKGALYTVLLVYIMLIFTMLLARLGYNKTFKSGFVALVLMIVVIGTPWLYESYIYTSKHWFIFNKTLLMTSLDWGFMFLIFGFLFGLLIRSLLDAQHQPYREQKKRGSFFMKWLGYSVVAVLLVMAGNFMLNDGTRVVVSDVLISSFLLVVVIALFMGVYQFFGQQHRVFLENKVNINFFKMWLRYSLLAVVIGLFGSAIMSEGAGIVVIETVKLFIFFLLLVLLLDDFQKNNHQKGFYAMLVFLLSLLIVSVVGLLKDTGSMLQVILAMFIIVLFLFDRLKKINFFNKIVNGLIIALLLAIAIKAYYWIPTSDNVRIPMWIEPFAQTLDVENKYFMYYFDQIGRGLYLMKESSLLPSDFVNNVFTVLPNLHTDYIFAFTLNVFGWLVFVAMGGAFIITVLSFRGSIYAFQNSKTDIYRFIYGVNVIFVAYFFSYIMINILAVLQVIPLTDVPFPILTYARGVTILFFILYIFVVVVNYLYLDFVSRKFRGRV